MPVGWRPKSTKDTNPHVLWRHPGLRNPLRISRRRSTRISRRRTPPASAGRRESVGRKNAFLSAGLQARISRYPRRAELRGRGVAKMGDVLHGLADLNRFTLRAGAAAPRRAPSCRCRFAGRAAAHGQLRDASLSLQRGVLEQSEAELLLLANRGGDASVPRLVPGAPPVDERGGCRLVARVLQREHFVQQIAHGLMVAAVVDAHRGTRAVEPQHAAIEEPVPLQEFIMLFAGAAADCSAARGGCRRRSGPGAVPR